MMIEPALDELVKKVDSKYTLVVLAAKRARELTDGQEPMVKTKSSKTVTNALEEVLQGYITYERTKVGIK